MKKFTLIYVSKKDVKSGFFKMKTSFALLLTILIIAFFSLMLIPMSSHHTLASNTITQEYLYTQASLHRDFFKALLLNMEEVPCSHNLNLEHPTFKIYAQIQCIQTHALIDIFIEDKTDFFHIRLHERFLKKN